jgi:hypothetical protein
MVRRRRRRNPREIPPELIKVAIYGGLAFVAYKLLGGLLDKFRTAIDKPVKAAAEWYVGKPMEVAEGIVYLMPNGARVPASSTTPAGGGDITYLGKRYKLVAASPPGSGVYSVVPV